MPEHTRLKVIQVGYLNQCVLNVTDNSLKGQYLYVNHNEIELNLLGPNKGQIIGIRFSSTSNSSRVRYYLVKSVFHTGGGGKGRHIPSSNLFTPKSTGGKFKS